MRPKTWTLSYFRLEYMWLLGFVGSNNASQGPNNN